MRRPPRRLCGRVAGRTLLHPPARRWHNRPMAGWVTIVVYFLVAVAAAFVTASRSLPAYALIGLVVVLGAVAMLIRRRVLGQANASRVTLAWIVVYVASYFVVVAVFGR